MTLRRFSSRTEPLDTAFLAKSLQGASKYYRIAGYFRSFIFELVGEEISKIPDVKIICNSELDMVDFKMATGRNYAANGQTYPPHDTGYGYSHSNQCPGIVGFVGCLKQWSRFCSR